MQPKACEECSCRHQMMMKMSRGGKIASMCVCVRACVRVCVCACVCVWCNLERVEVHRDGSTPSPSRGCMPPDSGWPADGRCQWRISMRGKPFKVRATTTSAMFFDSTCSHPRNCRQKVRRFATTRKRKNGDVGSRGRRGGGLHSGCVGTETCHETEASACRQPAACIPRAIARLYAARECGKPNPTRLHLSPAG